MKNSKKTIIIVLSRKKNTSVIFAYIQYIIKLLITSNLTHLHFTNYKFLGSNSTFKAIQSSKDDIKSTKLVFFNIYVYYYYSIIIKNSIANNIARYVSRIIAAINLSLNNNSMLYLFYLKRPTINNRFDFNKIQKRHLHYYKKSDNKIIGLPVDLDNIQRNFAALLPPSQREVPKFPVDSDNARYHMNKNYYHILNRRTETPLFWVDIAYMIIQPIFVLRVASNNNMTWKQSMLYNFVFYHIAAPLLAPLLGALIDGLHFHIFNWLRLGVKAPIIFGLGLFLKPETIVTLVKPIDKVLNVLNFVYYYVRNPEHHALSDQEPDVKSTNNMPRRVHFSDEDIEYRYSLTRRSIRSWIIDVDNQGGTAGSPKAAPAGRARTASHRKTSSQDSRSDW